MYTAHPKQSITDDESEGSTIIVLSAFWDSTSCLLLNYSLVNVAVSSRKMDSFDLGISRDEEPTVLFPVCSQTPEYSLVKNGPEMLNKFVPCGIAAFGSCWSFVC